VKFAGRVGQKDTKLRSVLTYISENKEEKLSEPLTNQLKKKEFPLKDTKEKKLNQYFCKKKLQIL
jgi:hypothetical protein